MVVYLFSDIFKSFKRFFMVENIEETDFLYDIAYGLMPRQFEPSDEDSLIYDENDSV